MFKPMKKIFSAFAAVILLLSSCIAEEPLNMECDILGFDEAWLGPYREAGFVVGEPLVRNNDVTLTFLRGMDRSFLDPVFIITDSATISPANGSKHDFSFPVEYTVTSQDGCWSKKYTVRMQYPTPIKEFHFEHFDLDKTGKYYEFFEIGDTPDDTLRYWASGNPSYKLTGVAKSREDFPTCSWPNGYIGNCVRLRTVSTGGFGKMTNPKMPIAAGNLFLGKFNDKIAMRQPLQATEFGLQLVDSKPISLEGYYKYKAGSPVKDQNDEVIADMQDTCDIYSVVYEVDPNRFVPLDGENVLSSDRIVMMARIDKPGEPQEWTHFIEPYKMMPGKVWDEQRMANNGYAIAVVMTSSRQGAYFIGALDSELFVDEVKINWEK